MDTRALLDSLDVGVVAIAPDWKIVEWSAAAARIMGLPVGRALRRECWDTFPQAKGTETERVLRQVLADGRPRIARLPRGVPGIPGLAVTVQVTRGPGNHLTMVLQPAPEHRRPQVWAGELLNAVEAERSLYIKLFHSLPTPTLLLGDNGAILDANAEGGMLLGVTDIAALQRRSLGEWVPALQRARLAARLRDAAVQRQDLQLDIEVAGEAAREVKAVVVNLAATAEPAKLLFLAVDVSREVLLQRRLLQADRLSQLGALVSGVAHELNNPLAAIAAFAEMLAASARTPDLKESAGIIQAEALRAGRIVGTLLDFARQRPRVSAAVDLAEVVEQVLALQRTALKKARVRSAVAMPDDLPAVIGDPQELQQVVLNAVVNASQAIEGTGRPGQVLIVGQRTDGYVLVTVEDTGAGVPPEILDRVFEPFFTTKGDAGTGLGLAISFGLVRGMGGRMWMQNVEGGGARLAFELPLDTTQAPAAGAAPQPLASGRRLAVLVVEDEDNVRRGMVLLAKRLGHDVISVDNFAEARHRLKQSAERYDVFLVDVHLDDAHTGFDLFEQLRMEGRGRERRIVFTTGDSISAHTRDELQRSERPVLRKPFSLQELSEILERVARG